VKIHVVQTRESAAQVSAAWDRISRMVSGLPDIRLERIAITVREGFAYNFLTEAAGGEEPWPQLAPRTQRERVALGYPPAHPILKRTRELYNSIVDPQHPLNYFWIEENAGRLWMEFGSLDSRFELLHAGGFNSEGFYVPPRPMTVLGRDSLAEVERQIKTQIEEWVTGL